jgi:hypothetical protein
MKLVKNGISFLTALLLVGVPTMSSAAQVGQGWQDAPWQFSANVYAWLPQAPATVKIDQEEVANLPESFDNIFDSLEVMAMFEFEARKGPLGFFISPIYYEGKDTEHFNGLFERRKLTLRETVWLINYGVGYEIGQWHLGETADSATVTVEPFVGGLYFHDNIKLDVDPGVLDIGLRIRDTIEFNTPIAGLNTLLRFNDRWDIRVSLNHGVFNSNKVNKTYQGIALLGYQFKMGDVSSQAFAGYRYTHVDYEDGPLRIEVDVKGPLLGIGWEF